jgi:NAD(P)H-hydrate repair Nnr-like enzyme with NAD(P)H-hydrate epimerase domain
MTSPAQGSSDQGKMLFIDTSNEEAQVAYVLNGNVVQKHLWPIGPNAGKEVLEKINEILKKNNVKLREIEKVAVYCGPGKRSSALRSGIVAASFLAFTGKTKLLISKTRKIDELGHATLSEPINGVVEPNYNNPGFDNNRKKL